VDISSYRLVRMLFPMWAPGMVVSVRVGHKERVRVGYLCMLY